ncbi:hypothetical protein [Echinimonas agarilytica]|uniref:Uncharacterized protein n=1 Tax=Echinimonas agarilytica TaxID=1215918 RepID=A0AA41W8D9_9GAMM|nr:hypothetical protein [Echinimonas agarilytica]MCM2680313.1 hypothetical protein [Echinimonas agarilytica]
MSTDIRARFAFIKRQISHSQAIHLCRPKHIAALADHQAKLSFNTPDVGDRSGEIIDPD